MAILAQLPETFRQILSWLVLALLATFAPLTLLNAGCSFAVRPTEVRAGVVHLTPPEAQPDPDPAPQRQHADVNEE
jgi:hypothetical protein